MNSVQQIFVRFIAHKLYTLKVKVNPNYIQIFSSYCVLNTSGLVIKTNQLISYIQTNIRCVLRYTQNKYRGGPKWGVEV